MEAGELIGAVLPWGFFLNRPFGRFNVVVARGLHYRGFEGKVQILIVDVSLEFFSVYFCNT
ncbi:MAG: hypothetical protein EA359_05295 [Balneolaceae bacterium]|nr:MAG: hypothetical protein EA359_05295 [Balneolaceae bacterium]